MKNPTPKIPADADLAEQFRRLDEVWRRKMQKDALYSRRTKYPHYTPRWERPEQRARRAKR